MRSFLLASLFALTQVACGSSSPAATEPAADTDAGVGDDTGTTSETGGDAASDTDNGAPSTMYPAPHPALPQLVNQAGGALITKPKVYLAYFPGYAFSTQVQSFAKTIGASSYWSAAVGEWGIAPIAYVDSKELTGETPPTNVSDTDVEAYIAGKIASGAFGTPDRDTIYTIFYPSTTTITTMGGFGGPSKSCESFGGYHSDTPVKVGDTTANYAFAVLPTCDKFAALKGIDGLTGALSHEWAEAVTDPFPSTNSGADSAYSGVDNEHVIWNLLGGAENGDLCAQRDDAFFKTSGFDFTTQSVWSNVAAKKGGDPCMPKPAGVYFNAAPVLTEKVVLDLSALGGGSVPTKGVKIAKGASKTIEVDLFSDGDTKGAWTVDAIDAVARFTGGAATLDFKWDRTSGQNGEKLHLTITVTGASAFGKAHPFIITSTLGGTTQLWPALASE
ncbi:MAG: hypothetical protein ACXWP4_15550 [Polyangiales bacterium]